MKFRTFLLGLSALFVAFNAAFFSVSGLSKLFAGASLSVMLMANSNELAINITDSDAPANSLDKPLTEKNAALNATNNADNPNSRVRNFITQFQSTPLVAQLIV